MEAVGPDDRRLDFEVDFAQSDFVPISGVEGRPVGIQGAIVPVGYRYRKEIRIVGTAFSIAPWGLFVTAAHVVEEAWEFAPGGLNSTDEFDLMIFVFDQGDSYPVWGGGVPVVHADFSRSLDLALLQVPFPKKHDGTPLRFEHLEIQTRTPRVGDDCFAFGYSEFEFIDEGSIPEVSPALKFRFNTARGQIQEIHPEGRDRFFVRYPSFTTGARFDGGMSGGPVIADTGRVIGVVSTSLPATDQDPAHISTCSLIPPLLGFHAFTAQPDNETPKKETLLDMAKRGLLQVDGDLDQVEVTDDGTYRRIRFAIEE